MIKKFDINQIRNDFEAEGYTLLTDTYKNPHTKLEYICPKGHRSYTTYSNWHYYSKRCSYCRPNAPVNFLDVKEAFEKEGYILLSKEYVKASEKLDYICPKGTHGSIPWNAFQQGHRCQCCYGKNIKLTIEEVRKSFEERGATLLDNEYINSKTKLNYICKNGHKSTIVWDSWKAGHGCPECAGNTKLTIEFIREEFAKEGYTLLENEYKGNKIKMQYICPKGHTHSVTWGKWKYGRRCPSCVGGVQLNYFDVKASFEKEGYTLLSNEYINAYTKLEYICPKGHKHSISWASWNNGSRCQRCAGVAKLTYDFVKAELEKEGYILLSDRYVNSKSLFDCICPNGHTYKTNWNHWNSGTRCCYCFGSIKHSYEYVKSGFEKEGYTLLSKEYKNARVKLDYVCSAGHINSMSWSNWNKGHRCPVCAIVANSGSGNHGWRGGISFEPYCPIWKDKEYKNDIKERDGNRCLNPYCEGKKGYSGKLVIHHINYNKKDCSPNNLITICNHCNIKANTNRSWHESWYKAIMAKRYNVYNEANG